MPAYSIHLPENIMKPFRTQLAAAIACAVLSSTAMFCAQETRQTVVHHAANPADETRPNSNAVPDVIAMTGHFDRIVILRFKYKTDLLAGLQKMVKQQQIKNAVILAALGSVRGYQIHQVDNRTFPTKDVFVKNPTQPADLVSMNGYVIDGRIHAHVTLATPDRTMAGHLEPGTHVFTFVLVTIGVLNDVDLNRGDDSTYR
jgi:predicted DNA-binding protein with PD1-like motif